MLVTLSLPEWASSHQESSASFIAVICLCLAVDTPAGLKSRSATYEIHLFIAYMVGLLVYLQSNRLRRAHRSLDSLTHISLPRTRKGDLGTLLDVLAGAGWELDLEDLSLPESITF